MTNIFTCSKFTIFVYVSILAVITTYFYLYFNISNEIRQSIFITNGDSIRKPISTLENNNDSLANCSIINPGINHYKVNIDGKNYPYRVPLYLNKNIDYDCMRLQNTKQKLILFWTTWFGDPKFNYGLGKAQPFVQDGCPIDNCETTNDKSRLNESDLVVVHMGDTIEQIPKFVDSKQRWIFFRHESPFHSAAFTEYNKLFSMSATYRWDSDFSGIYQNRQFRWTLNKEFNINQNFSFGKTEFAAMVASKLVRN
jgi:hypothetical protein